MYKTKNIEIQNFQDTQTLYGKIVDFEKRD